MDETNIILFMNLKVYYNCFSSRLNGSFYLVDAIILIAAMPSTYILQFQISSVVYRTSLYLWMPALSLFSTVCFFHLFRTYVAP